MDQAPADPLRPLAGQVALFTGGGGGIGRAIALALAGAGADVAIADVVPERSWLKHVDLDFVSMLAASSAAIPLIVRGGVAEECGRAG